KTMEKDERIGTRNYDLKAGKGIASEELFNDDFLKEMSEYTTSYFKSNDKYKAMVSTAQFAKGIEPNWVNFKNLCYKSADTLTVYFSSNTLFPASYGPTSMEVPLKNKKVYDAIKINMTGYERPKSMVDPTKPMIALSFDDGPYEPVTARILNALEKVGGRATFFVLGERLNESEKSREVMKRAYDMGCEIGNHSYDHADLARISVPKMQEQISKTNDLIKATIGQPGTLVRAPYGSINATVRSSVGGPLVNWSIDTLDWKTKNPSKIIPEVLEHVTDGDITLMHDIYKTSAEAAETIIPELARRGYQLVTISELMEAREVAMVSGKTYSQAYAKKAAE
ncbi:MAG: polysaccharide deacetylase family protein, partial [Clostridia bacterium]